MDDIVTSDRPYQYPDLDDQPNFPWRGESSRKRQRKHVIAPSASDGDLEDPEDDDDDPYQEDEDSTDEEDAGSKPILRRSARKRQKTEKVDEVDPLLAEERTKKGGVDDDENFYTLQTDVADFQERLRQRQESQPADITRDGKGAWGGKRGGAKGPRGPRKPVEPSLEIKLLLSQANSAFVSGEYEKVEEITNRVIQMNAEIYAAHALLSGVFLERGEIQMAIVASISAAHLRPKDPALWRNCATLILENGREDRAKYLNDAIYCYTRIIGINPKDFESRFERAVLLRELGHQGRAVRELEQILTMLPQDPTVLRQLAEIYIDLGEIEKAKQRYREYIAYDSTAVAPPPIHFDWSDVNIYVELFGYQGEYADGIKELKSLSRWVLGRREEDYWDEIQDDDREWDYSENPRRSKVNGYISGRFDQSCYGQGLPLELRVKLGVYRLKQAEEHFGEAMTHFAWLDRKDDQLGTKLFDYPDLFRESADALCDAGNYHEALQFYEPLQDVEAQLDITLYFQMAKCYRAMSLADEADQCYQTIIANDEKNIDARIELAKMYEEMNLPQRAFPYVNEVLLLRKEEPRRRANEGMTTEPGQADSFLPTASGLHERSQKAHPRVSLSKEERMVREQEQDDAMHYQYMQLQGLRNKMREGDKASAVEWMAAASSLLNDFRNAKVFYLWEQYSQLLGSAPDVRKRPLKNQSSDSRTDLEAMTERLHDSLGQAEAGRAGANPSIPTDYRRIALDKWLDIFLEYSLFLAKGGKSKDCYETLNAAYNANVFYHSHDSCFQIQACWAACALLMQDDEVMCSVARWFMREYQFTTDTYRLYAVLNRLFHAPVSWYNSGPSQKFLLRQVKAMDYSLVSEESRARHFTEKASYSRRNKEGHLVTNQEMDIALLMLYGQVLYVGSSYPHALNYFFRAYALDPTHPLINLHLALGYLHYALKRQSDNRHYLIMQGLSFLFAYHDIRMASPSTGHQQEANFNVARSFHMLGLTHLALPYYEQVLSLSASLSEGYGGEEDQLDPSRSHKVVEDFAKDAAFNLQSIYALGGNMKMAREVTEKWLVI
ncbi:MAG: transcription factor TFIIIC subunit tfc4 [Sclerophora amabilis]|nr:MAG: transcription factor TFIIIC subunit tfc4 [Sclerophora amabilis]